MLTIYLYSFNDRKNHELEKYSRIKRGGRKRPLAATNAGSAGVVAVRVRVL